MKNALWIRARFTWQGAAETLRGTLGEGSCFQRHVWLRIVHCGKGQRWLSICTWAD